MRLFKIFCKKKKKVELPQQAAIPAIPVIPIIPEIQAIQAISALRAIYEPPVALPPLKKPTSHRKTCERFGVSFPIPLLKQMDRRRKAGPVYINRSAWLAKAARKALREKK